MDYKEFSYYTAMGSSRNLKNNQDDVDYLFELPVLFCLDWFVSLTWEGSTVKEWDSDMI